jgi:DNA-binding response OmpR family regulator
MTSEEGPSGPVKRDPAIRTVLHVSSSAQGANLLRHILPSKEWRVEHSATVSAAMAKLRRLRYDLVLFEHPVTDGTWLDIRDVICLVPNPPVLIVASPFADERFWAEALNLGAYDVLAKPFDATEVNRVLTAACRFRDRSVGASSRFEMSTAAHG